MAGLVPAIPTIQVLCPPDRDRRDEPGDDERAATIFALLLLRHLFAWIVGRIHIGELEGALAVHLHDSLC